MTKNWRYLFAFSSVSLSFLITTAKPPKLTVILVIDQLAAYHITKLRPYLSGGLKFLSEEGLSYLNAFYDHSPPATGPGHTLLATGTYASFHGIIGNTWFSKEGKSINCDDALTEDAAVFAPDGGLYPYGKSAENTLVDTLSDQLVLHSYPHARNSVWSLSIKSRAAIAMAGRLGKPLWFDTKSGNFTSSKAYFDKLPDWVNDFNKQHAIGQKKESIWKPFFENTSNAYAFDAMNNYQYTIFNESILNKPLEITFGNGDKTFERTPEANQLLLDLATQCIDTYFTNEENERLVLWVSMSGFDVVAHTFGPHSKEIVDTLYHIDNQLKEFIDNIYQRTDKEEVLFVLTADHGGAPIAEVVANQGLSLAKRYYFPQIVEHLNKLIAKKYSIENVVQNFKEPQFYLNQDIIGTMDGETRESICEDIKNYMLSLPGVRNAWTFDELKSKVFQEYDLDRYIQRQLFRGRSGDIIYSLNPYTTLFSYEPKGTKGTSHVSPYAYDTHVPLIFYWKDHFEKKRIAHNVSMSQVACSLATLFEVPRPSASAAQVLPKLPL